jgi:hypothetical protein
MQISDLCVRIKNMLYCYQVGLQLPHVVIRVIFVTNTEVAETRAKVVGPFLHALNRNHFVETHSLRELSPS